MTDLEQRIRDLLDEDARSAPSPHGTAPVVRRTRGRQAVTLATSAFCVIALVAASIVGVRAVLATDGGTPADAPTVTTTMNGISITYPEGWHLIDPDEAGLNGSEPTQDLPRLVLALSPQTPSDLLACPGMVEGEAPTFLMTIQEEPLVLAGDASGPWPVALEPMAIEASGPGCYPGWEHLRAGWTVEGRTFEARAGFAPNVSDGDREALFEAFSSMTFDPPTRGASSVVLATGTAGGEDWELIATRQVDGLSISLQAESFGTGTGGFDPTSDELRLTSHVFGDGVEAQRVVFAAVPADVVLIVGVSPASTFYPEILDVPDEIDPRLNAFTLTTDADTVVAFEAFNGTDELVASGGIDTEGKPLEPALPEPDEVLFDGRTNDCWWALTRTSAGSDTERLQLVSPLGDLLAELVADIGAGAPQLQADAFDCPSGGTLTFGVATSDVKEILWTSASGATLRTGVDCIASDLPETVCVFLSDHVDVASGGEALALDGGGNEIGRASFG